MQEVGGGGVAGCRGPECKGLNGYARPVGPCPGLPHPLCTVTRGFSKQPLAHVSSPKSLLRFPTASERHPALCVAFPGLALLKGRQPGVLKRYLRHKYLEECEGSGKEKVGSRVGS